MSNAIGIVVSGNRAVDENAVVDSALVDVVLVVVGVGVVVGIGSFEVVILTGLVGAAVGDVTAGCFDDVVVVVTTFGFVGAADVDAGLIGFLVGGFLVGISSSTVVYVTLTLELRIGVCVPNDIVDDGLDVVGFGFDSVVDGWCMGEVYSLPLDDDVSPWVTFNLEIVVSSDGPFVSMTSMLVV